METKETSLDVRKPENLAQAVGKADILLSKSYLSALNTAHIIAEKYLAVADNAEIIESFNKEVRFFDITQIVLNKNENMRDKLVTVFNSVGSTGGSLLLRIRGTAEKVTIQFGVRNTDVKKTALSQEVLKKNMQANFPGSLFSNCDKSALKKEVLDTLPFVGVVSSVTDVARLRFEEETKDRQYIQGIEKLIDTMQGKEYSLLLIADPVSLADLNASRRALENLYSSLVPFSESQFTVGANESDSVSQPLTRSVTDTVNESVSETVTHTVGKSETTTQSVNAGDAVKIPVLGGVGGLVGYGFSKSHGANESDSTANGKTQGTSRSEGTSNATNEGHSTGSNQGLQIKFENHAVKQLMERIDETLKRYNTCADLGMWNCAVYCISESEYVS